MDKKEQPQLKGQNDLLTKTKSMRLIDQEKYTNLYLELRSSLGDWTYYEISKEAVDQIESERDRPWIKHEGKKDKRPAVRMAAEVDDIYNIARHKMETEGEIVPREINQLEQIANYALQARLNLIDVVDRKIRGTYPEFSPENNEEVE